jgi:hypothetical protein
MSPEKEKKIIPEKERLDVLEKISIIIEKEGKENLEKPEVKEKIVRILEGLFEQSEQEEKTKKKEYDREIAQTVEEARNNFEKEWAEFSEQPILDAETQTSQVIQQMTAKLEKIEPEPVVQEYLPVKETKAKTLLAKAGGLFKKSSTLQRWAGILSLSILFHTGAFLGLEKLSKKEIEEAIKSRVALNDKEFAEFKKAIKTEERKEFNENYLDYDIQKLSNLLSKMKYLKERFPECWQENEVGYILESDDPETKRFLDKIDILLIESNITRFNSPEQLEEIAKEHLITAQYLDKEINLVNLKHWLQIPEYLCLSHAELYLEGAGKNIESYYQVVITVFNVERSTIVGQFSLSIDPDKLNKKEYQEAVKTKILEQAEKIKNKRDKERLPQAEKLPETQPKITIDNKKYKTLLPAEKKLLEKGSELVKKLSIEFIVENPEGYHVVAINNPTSTSLEGKPWKINGKLNKMLFELAKDYKIVLNNQKVEPVLEEDSTNIYNLGRFEYRGSMGAVSQEKEIIVSIIDKNGQEVGRLSFEQVPEWFITNVYYQNVESKMDSVGLYITDADTLNTYRRIGREKTLADINCFVEGIVNVEEFFDQDLELQKIKLGSDIEESNAFFNPADMVSIYCLAPLLEDAEKNFASQAEKEKYFRAVGQHELLHKLDAFLGDRESVDNYFLSDQEAIKNIFNKHKQTYKDNQVKSLLFWVKECQVYPELKNAGHPEDNPTEFFVSSLNIIIISPEKFKEKFANWPENIQKDYIEAVTTISKELRKKNVETKKLQETIQYLIDLRTGKNK